MYQYITFKIKSPIIFDFLEVGDSVLCRFNDSEGNGCLERGEVVDSRLYNCAINITIRFKTLINVGGNRWAIESKNHVLHDNDGKMFLNCN